MAAGRCRARKHVADPYLIGASCSVPALILVLSGRPDQVFDREIYPLAAASIESIGDIRRSAFVVDITCCHDSENAPVFQGTSIPGAIATN